MRRILLSACLLCLSFYLGTGPALAQEGRSSGGKRPFSDEAVQQAIKKGVEYLLKTQRPDGTWPEFGRSGGDEKNYHPIGPTALATYALLEAGVVPQDARMVKALTALDKPSDRTYTLGLRAQCWLSANRDTGNKYMKQLVKDTMQLVHSTKDGAYDYGAKGDGQSDGDNSNSQYGHLGVWAGSLAEGMEDIPDQYWYKVMRHWLNCQNGDGGWGYKRGEGSTATMSAAGVASLLVCFDNDTRLAGGFLKCDLGEKGEAVRKPIQRGLDWFDRNFVKSLTGRISMGHGDIFYYLYGVERVGLACGYKYFGAADWYKLGAVEMVASQKPDGSWKGRYDANISTAFALLFLVRGRHTVLMNKLEYTGDWNNRPRDLASLTRWVTRKFEKTVNWQIIDLKAPVSEWHDAPILYIAGSKKPSFTDEEMEKLRTFVWQGGAIFSVTECSGTEFKKGIREVYASLFPKYELKECNPKHEIYSNSVNYDLRGRPRLHEVSNGVRPLAIHCDEDLPLQWQSRNEATGVYAYQGAANAALYITDKNYISAGGRARGTTPWLDEPKFTPKATVKLARLKHSADYDPEPLAYERLARMMGARHEIKLEVVGPIDIKDLPESGVKLACMTGVGRLELSDQDKETIKKFVQDGGTLVIDAAGGPGPFADDVEKHLAAMFGRHGLRRLSVTSPVFNLPKMEISDVAYRSRALRRLGKTRSPVLQGVLTDNDRIGLFYSREDLTGGLVGYTSFTCDGYDPESAFQIMRNIVCYAAGSGASPAGAPATPTAPTPKEGS